MLDHEGANSSRGKVLASSPLYNIVLIVVTHESLHDRKWYMGKQYKYNYLFEYDFANYVKDLFVYFFLFQ